MNNNLPGLGVALAAWLPLLATAQAAKTEPPKAAPQLTYQSAFADYKPYKDAPPANWRVLNDTVAGAPGAATGHAGHSMGGMKGMEMPATTATLATSAASAASAASASAPTPLKPMQMHDGHPTKRGKP